MILSILANRKIVYISFFPLVFRIKFYFYHVEIFYVKDITEKKVADQNQEVEVHIAGFKGNH
jgi:hypothetical protein